MTVDDPRDGLPVTGARSTGDGRPSVEDVVASLEEEGGGWANRRLLRRFFFLVLTGFAVYLVIWRGSHFLFAPRAEAVRPLAPPGQVAPGTAVTLGAVVRNDGIVSGAAFVVASLGPGREVEGPTVDVPGGDSAVVPVRMTLGPGRHAISLIVFDGWRGVRRLETFGDVPVTVGEELLGTDSVRVPERIVRGSDAAGDVQWANRSDVPRELRASAVFRPAGGGTPHVLEGSSVEVGPYQSATLEMPLDTWHLPPGSYDVDVQLYTREGQRIARSRETVVVEVVEG